MAETPRQTDKRITGALSEIGVPKKSINLVQGGAAGLARRKNKSPDVYTDVTSASLTKGTADRHADLIMNHVNHLVDRGVRVSSTRYTCGHMKLTGVSANSTGMGGHSVHQENISTCPSCRTS